MNAVLKYLFCFIIFLGSPSAFAQKDASPSAPDDPVANYNAGIASYRKDDFKAAKELFTKSLVTENKALETKAEYNIGNSLFKIAKTKEASDTDTAIDALKQASHYYQKAMDLDPRDLDAKYNHELSQKLIKILLEKPKTQKPQNQNKDQKNQDQQKKQQQNQQQNQQGSQQEQSPQQKEQQDRNQQQQQPKDGQEQKEEKSGSQKEDKLSEEEARMLASQFGQENLRLELNREQNNHERNISKDW